MNKADVEMLLGNACYEAEEAFDGPMIWSKSDIPILRKKFEFPQLSVALGVEGRPVNVIRSPIYVR